VCMAARGTPFVLSYTCSPLLYLKLAQYTITIFCFCKKAE
jgi:hypothetical protein